MKYDVNNFGKTSTGKKGRGRWQRMKKRFLNPKALRRIRGNRNIKRKVAHEVRVCIMDLRNRVNLAVGPVMEVFNTGEIESLTCLLQDLTCLGEI